MNSFQGTKAVLSIVARVAWHGTCIPWNNIIALLIAINKYLGQPCSSACQFFPTAQPNNCVCIPHNVKAFQ